MKSILRCLAIGSWLLFPCLAVAVEEASPIPGEARSAALGWLKLVDEGKYADSWTEASSVFKETVTEQKWAQALGQFREPLGSVNKRQLKSTDFTHEVPHAPRGDYWVIQFLTDFDGNSVIESLNLLLDKDGKWHVSGYAIKSAE